MIYVFLDIDGVLNTKKQWKRNNALDYKCINNFKKFIDEIDGRVILTSSWKEGYFGKNNPSNARSIKELEKSFSIYGKVKDGNRLDAVHNYIKEKQITKYIIIDDDPDEYNKDDDMLYFVDANDGFQKRDAIRCVKMLN